ncbi:MAG: BACON domain-containing protein [Muribaculaceae bacterium]|nr:BACON domain-containing protein [Muribaculaceae bacterium]
MKNFLYVIFAVALSLGFAACGGDDDGDEPAMTLSVSPTSLSLLSGEGQSTTFQITCSGAWNASCSEDWVHLSARSGTGSTSVTVSSLSENSSSTARTAEITVTSGDQTATISISQEGGAAANCDVTPKDILVMADGLAFKIDYGSKVSYYYTGYLEANQGGWTDALIIETLKESFPRRDPDSDDIIAMSGMDPNTDYYIVTVGFTSQEKAGEVHRERVTTRRIPNNYPWVSVSNVRCNSTKFYWDTEMNGSTSKYYMLATSDAELVTAFSVVASSFVAYLIDEQVKDGDIVPWAQSSGFNTSRESNSLYVSTWGMDANSKWAPVINEGIWSVNNSAPQMRTSPFNLRDRVSILNRSALGEYRVYSVEE